ncbi:hypothetical protein LTS10_002219 [Elasticomyces elasticus]|nr:hypothetical protein LTS10_002219 [Elasticomyces elasticus]
MADYMFWNDGSGGGGELEANQECSGVKEMMAAYRWGLMAAQTPDIAAGRESEYTGTSYVRRRGDDEVFCNAQTIAQLLVYAFSDVPASLVADRIRELLALLPSTVRPSNEETELHIEEDTTPNLISPIVESMMDLECDEIEVTISPKLKATWGNKPAIPWETRTIRTTRGVALRRSATDVLYGTTLANLRKPDVC